MGLYWMCVGQALLVSCAMLLKSTVQSKLQIFLHAACKKAGQAGSLLATQQAGSSSIPCTSDYTAYNYQ
jgi:hypothetical protein